VRPPQPISHGSLPSTEFAWRPAAKLLQFDEELVQAVELAGELAEGVS
jgi:hypothetical protein